MRALLFNAILLIAMSAGRVGGQVLPSDCKVRDEAAAKAAAGEYYAHKFPGWLRLKGPLGRGPFRADAVFFTRSPVSLDSVLKAGDAIWVVDVVNDALSKLPNVPVGIIWIRAEDGAVFSTVPQTT